MKRVVINMVGQGLRIAVRETEDPATWELELPGVAEERSVHHMLNAAEDVVLRNGGERIVITCGSDQETMRVELGKRVASEVSREGDRYTMQLIVPDENGVIHDDDVFRTPLHRLTCTQCVSQIAESRTRRRVDALVKVEGPKAIAVHSRLIAEAYNRLAEIEEAMQERLSPPM